jgi:8-oxo-dGTP pyrophosphatase MutT (NUDIX family)
MAHQGQPLVGKVSALIVRPAGAGHELLLFQHAHAGIQIPAGTIEPGETPEQAVLREAAEETGLTQFSAPQPLGARDELLPDDQRMLAESTPLYTRPGCDHTYGLRLRSGIAVRLEREQGACVQVSYEEWDDPQGASSPVSYRITGWVPAATLARGRRRHFFLLRYADPTPANWPVETDDHHFVLFWARLDALPAIVPQQAGWLAMLPAELRLEIGQR